METQAKTHGGGVGGALEREDDSRVPLEALRGGSFLLFLYLLLECRLISGLRGK